MPSTGALRVHCCYW